MLWVDVRNIAQKRTIRPLYEHHQATPHAVMLDESWDRHVDIFPGMVMTLLNNEFVTLSDGGPIMASWGLMCHFVAPIYGIDELVLSGQAYTAVWRGGPDAVFEILAPAFDVTKTWTMSNDGSEPLLVPGSGVHNRGKLCPAGVNTTVGYEVNAAAHPVAKLIDVASSNKIVISLDL